MTVALGALAGGTVWPCDFRLEGLALQCRGMGLSEALSPVTTLTSQSSSPWATLGATVVVCHTFRPGVCTVGPQAQTQP